MHASLNIDLATDFVIATGTSISLRVTEIVFSELGLVATDHILPSHDLVRSGEPEHQSACPDKLENSWVGNLDTKVLI